MSLARRMTALAAWLLVAAFAQPTAATAQQIRYGYDDLGRLPWAQDASGDVAIYVYDAVGNILQIIRGSFPDPNAPVAISAFTPTRGSAGTTSVTIFGRGFSATPSQNQVTFNGLAASVTAASPTQLTAVTPAGATTGKVAVSVGGNTGTSAQDFIVLLPPVVTPPSGALYPRESLTFTATQPAQWRANNVVNGNATLGTLAPSPDGRSALYTAPAALPPTGVVQISAAHRDDFTLVASATVEILPRPRRTRCARPW